MGTYTFEELCREWVYVAAETRHLPFLPQRVGSHWSTTEQVDVVAINWDEAEVLFGECKWTRSSPLSVQDIKNLVERGEQVPLTTHSGNQFHRQYLFFAREGFTPSARALAADAGIFLVDLDFLEEVLAEAVR